MNDDAPGTPHTLETPNRFESSNRLESIVELLEAIKELGASYASTPAPKWNDRYSSFAFLSEPDTEPEEVVAGRLELTLMREVLVMLEEAGHSQSVNIDLLLERLSGLADDPERDVIGEVGIEPNHTLKLSRSA
ncbi:MAG: hypothetical protein ACYTGQ_17135 [Planctomycetota bacterium]|jgi:hypothetical protein